MERLQKVMAQAGVGSRRQCEVWIQAGWVKVNGQVVTELGRKVDTARDIIEVKGKVLVGEKKRTFLFYKPLRVITSMSDPQGRATVADYFQSIAERVYPIGRLDFDTEGLLLMTNDGELANRLMHPKFKVEKTYLVTVKGSLSQQALEKLKKGVKLEDGWTFPAKVRLLGKHGNITKFELVIKEGRNRQIRRMCEAIGFPVQHLIRTSMGSLQLHPLQPGKFRELTKEELKRL